MEQMRSNLQELLAKLAPGGLCVAFSGGVDSALVLKAACETGARVHAVTLHTLFHTAREPEECARLAAGLGADHTVLAPQLPAALLQNPSDRCYLCKGELFSQIRAYADSRGLMHLLDGTNADDLGQYRPGLKALGELGVHSPLAQLGLTKAQVRRMAAEWGIEVADKPSAPCLATRYPYDVAIDVDKLPGIDRVEQLMRSLGAAQARARVEGEMLRLEAPPEDFPLLLAHREALVEAVLNAGFAGAALDLEGFRSGSMDIRQQRLGKG